MNPIYMDYAATTPTDKKVIEAMLPYFGEVCGNPSSLHAFGQEAKAAVEGARKGIASFLGAEPGEIVFTSGGTESDNFAIKGVAYANRKKGDHIITSGIEHHAVLETCRFLEREGFRVTTLPVDGEGLVDPAAVAGAMTDKTILISIMHANNEIGTIQFIAEIGAMARERGIAFHTDAVQTFGHLPFTADELNCDLISASAHKLYGPKGVGLLYIRKGTRIAPFHPRRRAGKRSPGLHAQCAGNRRFREGGGTGGGVACRRGGEADRHEGTLHPRRVRPARRGAPEWPSHPAAPQQHQHFADIR
jgi:cysteine desulfurase